MRYIYVVAHAQQIKINTSDNEGGPGAIVIKDYLLKLLSELVKRICVPETSYT